MQMVARNIPLLHAAGMLRIAEQRVEIDQSVKSSAGTYPLVDDLPGRLLGLRVVTRDPCSFEGCQRRADDLDVYRVGSGDQLEIGADQFVGGNRLGGIRQLAPDVRAGKSEVVHTLEEHHMRCSRHAENIAVKASERTRSKGVERETIGEQTVARYALVHHGDGGSMRHNCEPASEVARPVAIRLDGRPVPIGERVAERNKKPLTPDGG